ncbi:hydroxymethylglutaryl-CoA reductase [Aspergillus avenaceus]|uniref:hydroxymethylglutaryl-CoA reductase (NADPH) n=1 Tax=Aspergillus avenaceus TaxID=36643 RepID=A0A5N6U7S7_ASPAV|nr:hydroxymethylglutaryl-CoA reductase [Aspergillus avenaceus]
MEPPILQAAVCPEPTAHHADILHHKSIDGQNIHDSISTLITDVQSGSLKLKDLDKHAHSPLEAVMVRRALADLPFANYDYKDAVGRCCENIIGYMPIPLGIPGQILIDGAQYTIPMATTEGALVASVSRGFKAINSSGGATTVLYSDGMTRAPCLHFPSICRAHEAKMRMESQVGMDVLRSAFQDSSEHCGLLNVSVSLVGNCIYPRFVASTGDAMGMNIVTKSVRHSISAMEKHGFDDLRLITMSGNVRADKKPAAINWIEGRGKSVVAQCCLPPNIIEEVLRTSVSRLIELNVAKNHIGSEMAGALGGYNAHASNIVSAIFLATGQDIAQNVVSSQCITTMEKSVGTIGGGTNLKPQASMLDILGVRGSQPDKSGHNAQQFARIVAAAVLAGELSLCSALASDDLVQSHMRLNRQKN